MTRKPLKLFGRSRRAITRTITLAALGVPAAVFNSQALGVGRTWVGPSGNWSVTTNWSGGVVPANNDDAVIVTSDAAGRLVTYDFAAGVALGSLSLSSAPILGAGSDSMSQAANSLSAFNELIGIGLASGAAGTGAYTQSGGTNSLTGGLYLGFNATGRGTYTLSNTGVLNLNSTATYVGNSGIGTFNQTGGTINSNSIVYVGFNASAKGTYTLNGAAAMLNIGALEVGDNGAGTFLHSAGTASLNGALTVGDQSTATGLYQLFGGTLLIGGAFNNEYIGNGGTGAFTQTGGTHILSSTTNTTSAGFLFIANNPGSVGTYSLSGATSVLSVQNNEDVGEGGLGTFNQSAGTNTCSGLSVGDKSAGTYLMGGGTLNVIDVGGAGNQSFLNVSSQGPGTFLHSGGTVNVGNPQSILPQITGQLAVGGSGTTGFGYYKLSAGTLNVPQGLVEVAGFDGGAGTFEQTGGKVNVNGLMLIGTLPGSAGAGTYLLSGGTLTVNPLTVLDSNNNPLLLDGAFVTGGGTLIGGASGGFFAGKLTQQGGTIAGVLRNQGTFVYQSGSFTGQLINQGTFVLNGNTFAPPQAITNDDLGAINASGTIAIGVINRGSINPTGGALFVTSVTNNGVINVSAGTSFNSGFVDNFGRVVVSGGELVGTGTISNNATGISGGGVLSGGGTVQLNITQNGGTLRADDPAHPLVVTTPIVISDPASQIVVAANSVLSLQQPLGNSALITLQAPGSRLVGATITNTGTIQGSGQVAMQVVNSGTIRAEGGALVLSDPNDTNSGQIQTGSNTVRFSSGLQTNFGTILLGGGVLDIGGGSITSTGSIIGHGTIQAGNFINSGTMIFSGATTDFFPPLTNQSRVTITGNGAATFYNPVNTSAGSINVTLGSTAVFLAPVTGLSNITGPGTKDFESTASVGAINASGTTVVGPGGNLTASSVRDGTMYLFGHAAELPDGTVAGTSRLNALVIDGQNNNWAGQWDLSNNALVLDYASTDPSPIATIANQIKSGYAGGSWTGNGITSSFAAAASTSAHKTAIGYAEASQLSIGSFGGQSVDSTAVLIRYTFAGDGNLDGKVDLTDFTFLAANFNGTNKNWLQGDFNFDGKVDLTDFTFLASNFNQTLSSSGLGATVPEPVATTVVAAGMMLGRRRRSGRPRRGRSPQLRAVHRGTRSGN